MEKCTKMTKSIADAGARVVFYFFIFLPETNNWAVVHSWRGVGYKRISKSCLTQEGKDSLKPYLVIFFYLSLPLHVEEQCVRGFMRS